MSQIKWKFYSVQTDSLNFEIHLRGELDEGWHIFSQYPHPDGIAIPTKITLYDNPVMTVLDSTSELGRLLVHRDSESGITERYYKERVLFITPVSVKDTKTPIAVKGSVHYQLCTSEKCLAPVSVSFTVVLDKQ